MGSRVRQREQSGGAREAGTPCMPEAQVCPRSRRASVPTPICGKAYHCALSRTDVQPPTPNTLMGHETRRSPRRVRFNA